MKSEENLSLKWALKYQQMGFYPIPIYDNTKKPVLKHKDKPCPTPDQIRAIWGPHPEYGIALKTVNHLVVDLDVGHEDGVNGITNSKKLREADWWPKHPWLQSTRGGGMHVFLMKPEGFKGRQNIGVLPGVDLKAGPNDIVTVYPTSGYEWVNWADYELHKPDTAPQQLIDALAPKPKKSYISGISNSTWHRPTGGTNTLNAINAIIHGLGDNGCRNNNAAKMVGTMLAIGVDPADVLIFVKQANRMTPEPLPDDEIERTFVSILTLHMNK